MCKEAEAVEGVNGEQSQPQVKGHAGKQRKEDPLLRVRLHRLPGEERRYERNEEDKAVNEEEDDDELAEEDEVVAEAARAVPGQVPRQSHRGS